MPSPRTPFVDFRTGHEFSAEEEEILFAHWYGTAERGRREYDKLVRSVQSREVFAVGVKPLPGDPVTLLRFNEDLTVRIWGKGMESLRQYCLDFISNDGNAIDNPPGLKVYAPASYRFGIVPPHSAIDWTTKIEVPTLEASLGSMFHTDEKYIVSEGATLQIVQTDPGGGIVLEKIITVPIRHGA
ncbi:hypothetical protein B0H19DRAFT_1311748 [Mycena capillaripes]|nr:hypothetical protein B0H19DRAFT_1311748 [Mycena capillaripes]